MYVKIKQDYDKIESEIGQEFFLNFTGVHRETGCFELLCMVKDLRHHFRKNAM